MKQRLRQLLTLGQNKQSSTEQVRELRWLEDIVKMSQSNERVSHECVLDDVVDVPKLKAAFLRLQ